jgi:hypothetical protein
MGHAIQVNLVLDNQLIYIMSTISIPIGFVALIDHNRRSFLWAGKDKAFRPRFLIAWDKVCTPKEDGD